MAPPGRGSSISATMTPAKIAKKYHACGASPCGGGSNASASVTAIGAIAFQDTCGGLMALAAAGGAGEGTASRSWATVMAMESLHRMMGACGLFLACRARNRDRETVRQGLAGRDGGKRSARQNGTPCVFRKQLHCAAFENAVRAARLESVSARSSMGVLTVLNPYSKNPCSKGLPGTRHRGRRGAWTAYNGKTQRRATIGA